MIIDVVRNRDLKLFREVIDSVASDSAVEDYARNLEECPIVECFFCDSSGCVSSGATCRTCAGSGFVDDGVRAAYAWFIREQLQCRTGNTFVREHGWRVFDTGFPFFNFVGSSSVSSYLRMGFVQIVLRYYSGGVRREVHASTCNGFLCHFQVANWLELFEVTETTDGVRLSNTELSRQLIQCYPAKTVCVTSAEPLLVSQYGRNFYAWRRIEDSDVVVPGGSLVPASVFKYLTGDSGTVTGECRYGNFLECVNDLATAIVLCARNNLSER